MSRIGYVYVSDQFAGIIEENESGYQFSYDETYLKDEIAQPISLTMPLDKKTYQSTVLFPFFDGLIPEGWMLDVIINNWKINEKDRFGILLVACKDCIGNVSILGERL